MSATYYVCKICFCEYTSRRQIGGHLQKHGRIPEKEWDDNYLELPKDIAHSNWFRKKRKAALKKQVTQELNSPPKKVVKKSSPVDFLKSREWKELRYKVLVKYGNTCMSCGRNPKEDGVIIHIDHIKPRIKYPKLALDEENLQVLCGECNQGKSYIDETDWRNK